MSCSGVIPLLGIGRLASWTVSIGRLRCAVAVIWFKMLAIPDWGSMNSSRGAFSSSPVGRSGISILPLRTQVDQLFRLHRQQDLSEDSPDPSTGRRPECSLAMGWLEEQLGRPVGSATSCRYQEADHLQFQERHPW